MVFLVSKWSTKSHTFVASWGEFCPTLEDVIVLTGVPLFGEVKPLNCRMTPMKLLWLEKVK